MWLDLSEIPPSQAPSPDTEAFEKFAKQFFEELYDGEIQKTAGRGADGRVDIIVQVGDEKWLVSCKHWVRSTVNADDEKDPRGRLDAHGCHKFVGFYSCGPTNGLNAFLAGIRNNHPTFKFEIFNDKDIEARIFSFTNACGWIMAARWFPKSYAKLFSQLVHPLDHYGESDVLLYEGAEANALNKVWAGPVPVAITYVGRNKEAQDQAKKMALFAANEFATSQAFSGIFFNRIAEFAALFPGSFVRMQLVPDENLGPYSIFPSWNMNVLSHHALSRRRRQSAFAICRVWSLWDAHEAGIYTRAVRMLEDIPDVPDDIPTAHEVMRLYDDAHGPDSSKSSYDFSAKLTLSDIAAECSTLERGYFAGLLCFMPGRLRKHPERLNMAAMLAEDFGETDAMVERLDRVVSLFRPDDQKYVQEKSISLLDKLVAVCFIDYEQKYQGLIEDGLRCFGESGLEAWVPPAQMSRGLAEILLG